MVSACHPQVSSFFFGGGAASVAGRMMTLLNPTPRPRARRAHHGPASCRPRGVSLGVLGMSSLAHHPALLPPPSPMPSCRLHAHPLSSHPHT